ncbi:hypothetical protein SNEBB_000929 [Seison nebaliae]|nr:hypothetical protein SNEBB_000929 [Seison nebaliae]
MEEVKFISEPFFDQFLSEIQRQPNIIDIKKNDTFRDLTLNDIEEFEQNEKFRLPKDLKEFYLWRNGIHYTWNWNNNKDEKSFDETGSIYINPLQKLSNIHRRLTNVKFYDQKLQNFQKHDIHHIIALDLDSQYQKVGRIVLILMNEKRLDYLNGVWIILRGNVYLGEDLPIAFPLVETFLQYYRVMLAHYGMVGWQYLLITRHSSLIRIPSNFKKLANDIIPARVILAEKQKYMSQWKSKEIPKKILIPKQIFNTAEFYEGKKKII